MTIPIEEIIDEIKGMGYVTATPRKFLEPSFYKLEDGVILSLLVRINHLVVDPFNPNSVSINSVNNVHVFVEKNKRNPITEPVPDTQLSYNIINDDVEYTTLREEFNVYDLSNGDIMSVKSILAQVRKTDKFSNNGEPIYTVEAQPVIKIKKNK